MKHSKEYLIAGIKEGDKRCASLVMSLIENGSREGEECLKSLGEVTGRSYRLGMTGWPGVGKSTLTARLARSFLAQNKDVGIIAIDPTSPFSGGSLLGDRERMKEIDGDERLFIRSAATRGHRGGIANGTQGFIRIMEAMGKTVILLETVGVGQNQVSVAEVADTVVLAVIPGMGDYLQSLKAGVLEIGDVFVVNKSDREGAARTVNDLKAFINLSCCRNGWKPPVLKTIATIGQGIDELMSAIGQHQAYLIQQNLMTAKRESMIKSEILEIIQSRVVQHIAGRISLQERLDEYARQRVSGPVNPYDAADEILRDSGIIHQTMTKDLRGE